VGSPVKPIETGITIGQVFLGKYRVDAILGHGGMGVVAQCTHLQLQDRVAIKMLRPDVLGDDDAVARFTREAQAAAKLKSEYVAKVTDVGAFENGVPYMVMEYLDGQDLGNLLDERRTLPVPWATDLILQACEALSEAHAWGIVHRDVKPTNLFVTWRPDGSALVKVLDFGISKMAMGVDMHLTQTQSLLGTPAYMSPEQMRSARLVDARSDVWSLGTVLYEAIEGRRPFEAESFSEMVVKVSVDPPIPMRNAPPALQAVIWRCLAKAPEQRYPNMAEVGRDLLPFSQDQHGGRIIVDRMERMVRRSANDWGEQSTGGGMRAPQALRDAGSRPVHAGMPTPTPPPGAVPPLAQMFAENSQPAMAPWAGGSQPGAPAWAGGTDPMAASMPGMPTYDSRITDVAPPRPLAGPTMMVGHAAHRKRGAWLAVIVIAAVAGIGIGIVGAMSGGDHAPTHAATKAPAAVDMMAQPAEPTTTTPTTVPTTTVTPTTVTEPTTGAATATPAAAGSAEPAPIAGSDSATTLPAHAVDVKPSGPARPHQPPAIGANHPPPPPTTAKPEKPPVEPPATEKPEKPVAKPCNPFANAHGC
jgi:serine/threonine-protein kinase